MAAATASAIGLEPLLGGPQSVASAQQGNGLSGVARANESANSASRPRSASAPSTSPITRRITTSRATPIKPTLTPNVFRTMASAAWT